MLGRPRRNRSQVNRSDFTHGDANFGYGGRTYGRPSKNGRPSRNRRPQALSPAKYAYRQRYSYEAKHGEHHHVGGQYSKSSKSSHAANSYYQHESYEIPPRARSHSTSKQSYSPSASTSTPAMQWKQKESSESSVSPNSSPRPPRSKSSSTSSPMSQEQEKEQEKDHQRDYRRVFGYYYCNYCQLQWDSPDTFQTINKKWMDPQECPGCLYPIVAYETHKLCVFCDTFPCRCCRQCKTRPCVCCVRCHRTPCQCCPRCGQLECAIDCCEVCEHCPCHCVCKSCGSAQKECTCEARVYGYYRCSECGKTWESAYTFVRSGGKTGETGKYAHVVYGQQCKGCECDKFHLAMKWEKIVCQKCLVKPCVCKDKRHINHEKNHMQSLCERCKNKENPCSSFRFLAAAHVGKDEQSEEVRAAEERGRTAQQQKELLDKKQSNGIGDITKVSAAAMAAAPLNPNMSYSMPMPVFMPANYSIPAHTLAGAICIPAQPQLRF